MYFVPAQCYYQFDTLNSNNAKRVKNFENSQRSRFTKEEDELLKRLVNGQTQPKWSEIAQQLPNRTSRQCRERYNNYLRPNLINGPWTKEEDELLKKLYELHGPKWAFIKQNFNSRSAVNVKNRYSTLINQSTIKNDNQIIESNDFLIQQTEKPKENKATISISEEQHNLTFTEEEAGTESLGNDNYYENMFSDFNVCDEMWSTDLVTLPDFSIFA